MALSHMFVTFVGGRRMVAIALALALAVSAVGIMTGTTLAGTAETEPVLSNDAEPVAVYPMQDDEPALRSHDDGYWVCRIVADFLPFGSYIFTEVCNWVIRGHTHTAEVTKVVCLPLPGGVLVCGSGD